MLNGKGEKRAQNSNINSRFRIHTYRVLKFLYSFGRNSQSFERRDRALFKIRRSAYEEERLVLVGPLGPSRDVFLADPRPRMNGPGERAFGDLCRRRPTEEELESDVPKSRHLPPPVAEQEFGGGPEAEHDVDSRLVLLVREHAFHRRRHGEDARADGQHHQELERVSRVGESAEGPPPRRLLPRPPLPDERARPSTFVQLNEDVETSRNGGELAIGALLWRREQDRKLPSEGAGLRLEFEHQVLARPRPEDAPAGEVELEGPARGRHVADLPQSANDVVFRAHFRAGRNAAALRVQSPLDPRAGAPPRLQLLLVEVENARTAALAAAIGGLRVGRDSIALRRIIMRNFSFG